MNVWHRPLWKACITSDILSRQFVNCAFVVLFCTRNIYCISVHPGRGIPPLRLFLRFLPSFFPCSLFPFFSFFSLNKTCFSSVELSVSRQRMPFTVQFVKAHWGDVIVISGCVDKSDLTLWYSHNKAQQWVYINNKWRFWGGCLLCW